jgi:hypothetical protein
LLDAGPDFTEEADTPPDLLDSRNLAGLEHDWGYTASPFQDAAFPIAEESRRRDLRNQRSSGALGAAGRLCRMGAPW